MASLVQTSALGATETSNINVGLHAHTNYASDTTPGNYLIAVCRGFADQPSSHGAFTMNAAPTGGGVTWTLAGQVLYAPDAGAGEFGEAVYYVANAPTVPASSSVTVVITPGGGGSAGCVGYIVLYEFSGIGNGGVATSSSTIVSSGIPNGGSINPALAQCLIFTSCFEAVYGSNATTQSNGAGNTLGFQQANANPYVSAHVAFTDEYILSGSSGVQTQSFSATVSANTIGGTWAFSGSPVGGVAVPELSLLGVGTQ